MRMQQAAGATLDRNQAWTKQAHQRILPRGMSLEISESGARTSTQMAAARDRPWSAQPSVRRTVLPDLPHRRDYSAGDMDQRRSGSSSVRSSPICVQHRTVLHCVQHRTVLHGTVSPVQVITLR
jgi:hypothetical protein